MLSPFLIPLISTMIKTLMLCDYCTSVCNIKLIPTVYWVPDIIIHTKYRYILSMLQKIIHYTYLHCKSFCAIVNPTNKRMKCQHSRIYRDVQKLRGCIYTDCTLASLNTAGKLVQIDLKVSFVSSCSMYVVLCLSLYMRGSLDLIQRT